MYDLALLLCFRAIYQTLSLTKAGEKLGLSKASVSKKLIALESELGGKLFIRSTRKISPTLEADLLYDQVDLILSTKNDIDSIFNNNSKLKGKIKVTAPQTMSISFLGETLLKFQKLYPEIRIELISTDSILDVIENDIDLSLRVNPPKDSSLVGKKIGSYQLHLTATPSYLKKNPIKNLNSLDDHTFMATQTHISTWSGKRDSYKGFMSNDSVIIGNLIRLSLAIGLRSNWDIKTDLKKGKLIEILPNSATKNCGEVWLLSHSSKIKIKRVHVLFDFLMSELKDIFN